MVSTITARNVSEALLEGLFLLKVDGVITESRVGRVVRARGPVITTYERPDERVLTSPIRDANPFFHLYESIWMMAGRDDAASVTRYAAHMATFANEEGFMTGAYGYRWRQFWGFDQLAEIIQLLQRDRTTRRAVLGMWEPETDLRTAATSKDVPCNTHVYFDATQGVLDMTVANRSNDIVWGAYGANAVHMSFLQEFIALAAGVPLGRYYQFSNNFHLYIDREDTKRLLQSDGNDPRMWEVRYFDDCRYRRPEPQSPYPVMGTTDWRDWLLQAERYAAAPTAPPRPSDDPFFSEVLSPMMLAHALYKQERLEDALDQMLFCAAPDWSRAGTEWLQRRLAKREAK